MAKITWNPPEVRSRVAHLISEVDYSAVVYFGATRADGTRTPPRPFLTDAASEVDYAYEFAVRYKATKSIDNAFDGVADALYENIKAVIKDERYFWDRVTHRRSGDVVGSPRDIYDMGDLYNSQRLEFIR